MGHDRKDIFGALGEEEPVGALSQTAIELEEIGKRCSRAELMEGEWSAHDVLKHLTDMELVYSVRIRMVVTESKPVLPRYDHSAWASRFKAVSSDPLTTLRLWQSLRRSNLDLYRSFTPDDYRRVGIHLVGGEESVLLMLSLLAGHERLHLPELRASLAATSQ